MPRNPLDELPPSSFNLEEFKHIYSNETESRSIKCFFDSFDKDGYSIYVCDFQYNHELDKIFKAAGLISGWFQRICDVKKYAFGSVIIFGVEREGESSSHDFESLRISGVWVFRGDSIPFEMLDCEDTTYYNWKKLDVENQNDKQMIEDYFSWDFHTEPGQSKFISGRIFK